MIIVSGEFDSHGQAVLIVGLTPHNMVDLLSDKSVQIEGKDIGIPGFAVVIIGGESDETLTADLARSGLIDSPTDDDH